MADRRQTTIQQEPVNPELIERSKKAEDDAYLESIAVLAVSDKLDAALEWCHNNKTHSQYLAITKKCEEFTYLINRTNFLLLWSNYLANSEYKWIDMYTEDISKPPDRVYTDVSYYNGQTGILLWEWVLEQIRKMIERVGDLSK